MYIHVYINTTSTMEYFEPLSKKSFLTYIYTFIKRIHVIFVRICFIVP